MSPDPHGGKAVAFAEAELKVLAGGLRFTGAPAELRRYLPSLTLLDCGPGDVLLKEGDLGADVYVIAWGTVTVKRRSLWLFTKDVAQLQAGDFFGEIAFLTPALRSASVVSNGASRVFRILAADMRNLLERRPELRAGLEDAARKRLTNLSSPTDDHPKLHVD